MPSEERTKEILKALHKAILNFEEGNAMKWAKIAIDEGVGPFSVAMDVLKTVIEATEKKAPRGFMLMSGCETPLNTPPANVRMMRKAIDEFGWYN